MRKIFRKLLSTALSIGLVCGTVSPAHAAVFGSVDHLGRPAPHILAQLERIAQNPRIPLDARNALLAAVSFYRGDGEGGVPLPEGAPVLNQFLWPTVSANCINGSLAATGTAIAIPGPADLPLPGTAAGQTTFVFTALGTSAAAEHQQGMKVHWLNMNTGKLGITPLLKGDINPQGPATLSGIADTGHGQVVAWLDGGVTLADEHGTPTNTCIFAPTATSFTVN